MADHEADYEVNRSLGRLEGRMVALETRVANLDTRADRQMNALAGKVGSLEAAITELRSALKSSWHTLVIIAACLATLISLAASLINLFWRH